MFVIRRIANVYKLKRDKTAPCLLTATIFFADALPKETAKQFLCKFPIVAVYTILHLWSFHLALY